MGKLFGRLVVHIGAPKTGTSSLQTWLQAKNQRLASQSVGAVFINNISSRDIAEYFGTLQNNTYYLRREIDNVELIVKRFRRFRIKLFWRLMRCRFRQRTTVLSSEHLYLRLANERAIRRFADFVDTVFSDVLFVVYSRDGESFQNGLYWEYLKNGGDWSRDEFMAKSYPPLDPKNAVRRWQNVIGKDRLIVRDYQELEKDIIFDFAVNILGLDKTFADASKGQDRSVRRNATPSLTIMEQLRNFNLENREYDLEGRATPGVLERRRTYINEIVANHI